MFTDTCGSQSGLGPFGLVVCQVWHMLAHVGTVWPVDFCGTRVDETNIQPVRGFRLWILKKIEELELGHPTFHVF